ncbi:MAG: CBS domain-containing protein [Trebonia sp.]
MSTFVKDVMTAKVIWVKQDTPFTAIAAALHEYGVSAATVAPDDTLEHAAQLMYRRKVKRLPVVDAGGHLVGIVSRADVLAVYDRPDVEIGEEIRNDIAVCESLADAERFDVTVTDGVVTLTGRPRTREQGRGIVRRARHVQGVVAVRDRLDYPPPGPGTADVLASFPVD